MWVGGTTCGPTIRIETSTKKVKGRPESFQKGYDRAAPFSIFGASIAANTRRITWTEGSLPHSSPWLLGMSSGFFTYFWYLTHALSCLGFSEQKDICRNQPVSQFTEEDRRLLLQRTRPTELYGRKFLGILKDLLRIVEYLKL